MTNTTTTMGATTNNIYDQTATTLLTEDQRALLINNFGDFIEKYGYPYTNRAINKIIENWHDSKQWIDALFRKHPNYVEGKYMIVLNHAQFTRTKDKNRYTSTFDWMINQYKEIKTVDLVVDGVNLTEMAKKEKKFTSYLNNRNINAVPEKIINAYLEVRSYRNKIRHKLTSMLDRAEDLHWINDIPYAYDVDKFDLCHMRNYLYENIESDNKANEKFVEAMNKICPDAHAHVGQKLSRIVNKFCVSAGIDKDPEYNSKFAIFADSINPIMYEKTVIISINPIDYLGMSLGRGWSSCMTIDINNTRGMANSYHGMYSGGIMGYMGDPSAVVVYSVTDDVTENYELADKLKRCMIFLGEDKIVQSRLYPDGRDGGENGLQRQFRTIVQKVISECCNVPNLWKTKVGPSVCDEYTDTDESSQHYRDYVQYDDGHVSFFKGDNGEERNFAKIRIGSTAICPNCGGYHEFAKNICCEDCADIWYCEECGETFNEDDGIIINDHHYCCAECAERAGYTYCENVEEWVDSDDTAYDEYYDRYFYIYDGNVVQAEDNTYFEDEYSAERANYVQLDDGRWMNLDEENILCSDWTSEYFEASDDTIYAEDGSIFKDNFEAIDAGYVRCVDDEYDTSEWRTIEDAENDGYVASDDDSTVYVRPTNVDEETM